MFQKLGSRGQQTRSNSKSQSNYDPFLALKTENPTYAASVILYKKKNLILNDRQEELKKYNASLAIVNDTSKKSKKQEKRDRRKQNVENYYRNQNKNQKK